MKRLICLILLLNAVPMHGSGLLSLGGGILEPSDPVALYQCEYKWDYIFYYIRPQVGVLTGEFRSFYAYIGLGIDLFILPCLVFTPSFSPGLYYRGSGKDLGYPLEFRSSLELALAFKGWRLGGEFYHLSNASLSSRNPGINGIAGFVGIPF